MSPEEKHPHVDRPTDEELAALGAYAKWASLMFMRGADLEDPDRLLEGAGKNMRHVKLRSLEQFDERRGGLRLLIEAATRVDEA